MIAIVNYGLGNLRSVAGALDRLGHEAYITNDEDELSRAEKLILPGVGAFGDGIKNLRALGLDNILNRLVFEDCKPILGICLGFQLMARESCEFGNHKGLGWIDAVVKKIDNNGGLRLPHVGWNDLFQQKKSKLFENIPKDALFYYVHSYHVRCSDQSMIIGECDYGIRFTAAIEKNNIFGSQFHPEKSQQWGLELLRNFVRMAW